MRYRGGGVGHAFVPIPNAEVEPPIAEESTLR